MSDALNESVIHEEQDHQSLALGSSDMLAARESALALLNSVLSKNQTLDSTLGRLASFKALPSRDRAFCRMLVATTLRRLGQVDDIIDKALERSGSETPILRHILRLGCTQILFMDVPDHAAVDTSVRLTDENGMSRKKGFVNGVLRTITRSGKAWLARQDETRLNTPEWLLKIWIEDYGMTMAAKISQAHLSEAPLDITVKDRSAMAHWSSMFKATQIGRATLRKSSGGSIHDMPGFTDGAWWIQDASAALPALLFGDITGQHVVDMCAAPGGKTMQLASMGARVTALDRSASRLGILKENLARVDLADHVEIAVADAGEWQPIEAPSYILLDAPCSATGTIRRHPDTAHLKAPRDIESLVQVQKRILAHAFEVLAPGGTLIYCVCSLQKSEGEDQIAEFLTRHPTASKIAVTSEDIGGLQDCITEGGDVRVLPFHQAATGGMDGFFISRLTKRG